eukprot:1668146-Prymnesium_polylepis.1
MAMCPISMRRRGLPSERSGKRKFLEKEISFLPRGCAKPRKKIFHKTRKNVGNAQQRERPTRYCRTLICEVHLGIVVSLSSAFRRPTSAQDRSSIQSAHHGLADPPGDGG